MQIFSAGRTDGTNQPKVVQEVLVDLKIEQPNQQINTMKEKKHKYADMYFSNINMLSKRAQNIIHTCHLTYLLKSPLERYAKTKQLYELKI